MEPADWVPMRWPSGEGWQTPKALQVLEGTPINCLVVRSEEATNERLVGAARARGLTVVEEAQIPSASIATVADETVWPGVKLGRSGDAEAGPTGPPWVDSNGWRVLLARTRRPGKMPWVFADPPADLQISNAQSYTIAIADAGAYGGRWVISLDAGTADGLLRSDNAALARWSEAGRALRYFEKHAGWRTLPTIAKFGVVSDFEGPNQFIAEEVLNLAPRRYLSCRVLELARTNSASLEGLKGLLWVNETVPGGEMLRMLTSWVKAGGLLILPASGAHLTDGLGRGKKHKTGYTVFSSGSGQIAVAPEPWTDPYVTVSDAHLLLSRQHDVFRVFNSGANNIHCAMGPEGTTVVHVINYTGRATANPMSLYVARAHRSARWARLGDPEFEPLAVQPAPEGVEVHLPSFASFASVEFGGQS